MSDIAAMGSRELLDAFRDRALSPVEAVAALGARIEAVDPGLGAFTTRCLERADQEAQMAERAYRAGARPRALEGLPLAAKDIIDSAGVRTTYGSPMFADNLPGADADALASLRAAGAILLGKSSTHEFAWGITSVNPRMGTSRNPIDPLRISGGSSGGSAVAVASHQVPVALGTDTGGSVRIPASFCGVAGFKPSYGTISRRGVWPLAPTLDHVGVIARTVEDLEPVIGVLQGTAVEPPGGDRGLRELRVGTCADLHLVTLPDDIHAVFDAAVRAAAACTRGVVALSLPDAPDIRPAFMTIQGAEAVVSHRRAGLFPQRASEYGEDVRGRLEAALGIELSDYVDACAARLMLDRQVADMLDGVDVMMTPITAVAPPLIGEEEEVDHLGELTPLRDCVMPYTMPQDLLGLPACAIPAGVDADGLPVGVQIWGRRGSDARVLQAAMGLSASGLASRE